MAGQGNHADGERAAAGAVQGGVKVPRFDYHKYLHGGAAGRRELVHGFGDALRDHGCARLQGHGEVNDAVAAAAIGADLLAALEGYFGLPAAALQGLAEGGAELVVGAGETEAGERGAGESTPASRALLVLVPEVRPGVQVRRAGGEWARVAANRGELLALPGEGLARVTAGIAAAAGLRLPEGTAAWRVCAPAGAELSPRPEFGR